MTNLRVLDIADTVTIEEVGENFFKDHKYIREVNLPASNFGENAFKDCDRLLKVDISKANNIGKGIFANCDREIKLTLGSQPPTVVGEVYSDYSNKLDLFVPTLSYPIYDNDPLDTTGSPADGKWFDWNLVIDGIVSIDYPWTSSLEEAIRSIDGIREAGDIRELYIKAEGTINDTDIIYLNSMRNLEILEVSDRVTIENAGDDFMSGIDSLKSLKLPATTFGNEAFNACYLLENVELDKVISFGNNAFNDCYSLKSISLPEVKTFADDAFNDCHQLENVELPKVESLGNDAFDDCYSLKSISLPEVKVFGNDAFEDCYQLKTLSLPQARTFHNDAFEDCYQLENVELPEAETFGNDAFEDCYKLRTITLPKATSFGDDAFENCYQLDFVSLPQVRAFGEYAFEGCIQKITLRLGMDIPTVVESTFSSYEASKHGAIVEVPKAMISDYDGDPQDISGLPDDGLWFGWKIEEIAVLDSITIKRPANKLVYTVGESLDITGLVIEGNYSNGSKKEEAIRETNISGFDSSIARASQVLTVDFAGKTTSYTVEIKALPPIDDGGSSGGDSSEPGTASASTYYSIYQKSNIKNGKLSIDKSMAIAGSKINITVTPNKGYALDLLKIRGIGNQEVEFTENKDGRYSFMMPVGNVEVEASFIEEVLDIEDKDSQESLPKMTFKDIKELDWFYESVKYLYGKGLMMGTNADTFSPNKKSSRAMIVTILYRLEESPKTIANQFTDVLSGTWYTDAVSWAAEKEVVKGYGNGLFGPNDDITREQLVTILYNYAKYKNYDIKASTKLENYKDGAEISDWARETVKWGVGSGIITGKSKDALKPRDRGTRAEIATMLERFIKNFIE